MLNPTARGNLPTADFLAVLAIAIVLTAPIVDALDCGNSTSVFLLGDPLLTGCTNVLGSVKVFNVNATDLSALSGITTIQQNLIIIENQNLTSLHGIDGLVSVGNIVQIANNQNLASLSGLGGLLSVGNTLQIADNQNLASLSGLGGLGSVGQNLQLFGNKKLSSFDGLQNLSSVKAIVLSNNDGLRNFSGLSSLKSMMDLSVLNEDSLMSLYGLDSLELITGHLSIENNTVLRSLSGLSGVHTLGSLYVKNNPSLDSLLGLGNVTTFSFLDIIDNPMLMSLAGLEKIEQIGRMILQKSSVPNLNGLQGLRRIDKLYVNFNRDIKSLQGLQSHLMAPPREIRLIQDGNLLSISDLSGLTGAGQIWIEQNHKLLTLDGLQNITHTGELKIINNGGLSSIEALAGLRGAGSYPHLWVTIMRNPALTSLDGLQQAGTINRLTIPGLSQFNGNKHLIDVCSLCSVDVIGDDLTKIPDFQTNRSFTGANASFHWISAGKICAVGPVHCPGFEPSQTPTPTPSGITSSQTPTRTASSLSPTITPAPSFGLSTTSSPTLIPSGTTAATSSPTPSELGSCTGVPPFPGKASCVNGIWTIVVPPGTINVNATVSVPIRVIGNITLSNQSNIRFYIVNSTSPLVIVDGDLTLDGNVAVDIDTATGGEFIPLYEVSGNITGTVRDVELTVENPEKCTDYGGEVVSRDKTVGVLVTATPQKNCGKENSNELLGLWGLMALLVVFACCAVFLAAVAIVVAQQLHKRARRSRLSSKFQSRRSDSRKSNLSVTSF